MFNASVTSNRGPRTGPARESPMFFISHGTRTGPCRAHSGGVRHPYGHGKGIDKLEFAKIPHGCRMWPYGPLVVPHGLFMGCLWSLNPHGARKLIMHVLKLYGPCMGRKNSYGATRVSYRPHEWCDGTICDSLQFVTAAQFVTKKCFNLWPGTICDQKCFNLWPALYNDFRVQVVQGKTCFCVYTYNVYIMIWYDAYIYMNCDIILLQIVECDVWCCFTLTLFEYHARHIHIRYHICVSYFMRNSWYKLVYISKLIWYHIT